MGQIINFSFTGKPCVGNNSDESRLSPALTDRPAGVIATHPAGGQHSWNAAGRTEVRRLGERRRNLNEPHVRAFRNAHYRAELEKLGLL
ncbi:hypothetical protein FKG94_09430 [Exilibacterium tricleocarpae]|uniref:Uncharacterized protein n=1 Tax=Exilibacterium tricleocarpae TaxID=2591008 RepID=A0A545TVQ9_9GAMM|nr:hypothetical protein [Exilibacterium tricleocarpae]TQV81305.1 hypothetical protein FKG94_09430 [Exilibacterium tricleocarpae]